MGAGNVKAVLTGWSAHVRDPAFRVLVAIALTTKDDDEPPIFWGGLELLAAALGRKPPLTDADLRAVGRAMGQLRKAGAIAQTEHSAPGRTARHELRLRPVTQDGARPVNDGTTPDAPRLVSHNEHRTRRGYSQDAPRPNTGRPASYRGVLGQTEEDCASHPSSSTGRAREVVDVTIIDAGQHRFEPVSQRPSRCGICDGATEDPRHASPVIELDEAANQ